ncbi:zinc-ribbon domain-containing protein [Desulfomonile tiedjei]|uniref:zinc-ribbon domain-containing protein n=1 Tax=Desulfomonile tiedjei TaxID=2358 RepID=UPI003EC08E2F
MAREWHPTKNTDLSPDMVTPGMNKKVWWQCQHGHEWKAVVASRAAGIGCPYCAGKLPSEEHNLAISHPELTKEWHPTRNENLTPFDFTPKSGRKVWWICKREHEWKAPICRRTGGAGCPNCFGTRVTDLNNLAVKFPQIAKQWHPTKNGSLTPHDVKGGSDKKVWWICPEGHEWERRVMHQVRSKICPICALLDREEIS